MKDKITVAFIGGDVRQAFAAATLAARGYECRAFGVPGAKEKGVPVCASPDECLAGADCVVLGTPFSRDGRNVNLTGADAALSFSALCERTERTALLLGGGMTDAAGACAARYGIRTADYLASDEVAILNAIPTAEGAIAVLTDKLDRTLNGSRVLVLGCGRVARALAPRLRALGAAVTVAARKPADRAWCLSCGLDAAHFGDPAIFAAKDAVINTVPAIVAGKEELSQAGEKTVLIELASGDGGFDPAAARELGSEPVRAPGLPGKVAPRTAGGVIAGSVASILEKEGMAP